jgi:hypothetical protein
LPGTDYISGYVHYYPSGRDLPSGFTANDRIKKIFSVADAEALGITNASLGETKAVAKIVISTAGTAGDLVTISYTGISGVSVKLVEEYKLTAGDVVSTTTAAEGLVAAINANTATHGFVASNITNSLFLTTKAGEGIFPNSGSPYAYTTNGTFAGTITQPTGSGSTVLGVASFIDIAYYHINEFFRIQPKGVLYVGMYVQESTYAYADVTSVINYAQGEVKQLAVYHNNVAFATTQPTALQAVVTSATTYYKPFIGFIQAEISGTASIGSLSDLSTLTAPSISVCIAQDNGNEGYHLYKATGKSIGAVGALLGSVAFAAVNESIAWVSKFNVANIEFDNIGFANGQVYTALADSVFETVNNYAYIFLRKLTNITGSYWSDSPTAVTPTSDYSKIENNRVYNKITRNVRASMLPALSSPLKVNANGTLSNATIGYFESLANAPLEQMEADSEISDYKIIINPNQDVLATSTLELTLQNVPMGVARIIKVNVGFVKSV